MSDILNLCDAIRETGYAIHRFLGPGHLESMYQRALFHRLTKQGILVQPKFPYLSSTKTAPCSAISRRICSSKSN